MQSTHSHAIPTHREMLVSREAGRRERPMLKRQRGMATLVTALVLLIAVTILTFNVAKVSGLEQRISANDVRTLAAHEAAQAGIEQAIAYLNANLPQIDSTGTGGWNNASSTPRWTSCATSDPALPCGDGQNNKYGDTWLRYTVSNQINLPGSPYVTAVHYLTLNAASASGNVGGAVGDQPRIIIIASATPNADPLAGSAVIQQITQYFSLVNMPSSPFAALGTVNLTGNIFVYGNPNPPPSFYLPRDVHGNPIPPSALPQALPPLLTAGQPLSVWSSGAMSVSGSAQTCKLGTDCSGANKADDIDNKLTDKDFNGGDIAGGDLKFPADTFQYVFGVPNSEAATIKAKSTKLTSCGSLTSASSGLFWVEKVNGVGGDCSVGTVIGSATAPAIIVVEGEFKMNSNDHLYGLVYVKGTTATVSLTGNPTLWGGLVSEKNINLGSGNYTSRYLDLSKIHGNNTGGFAKVPGGWLDAYQKPVP